jgi:hypothetical protein
VYPAGGQWVQIDAGRNHTLALRADGAVFAWGVNADFQSAFIHDVDDIDGDGNTLELLFGPVTTPRRVYIDPQKTIPLVAQSIAAGEFVSLAVTPDGKLFSWGTNSDGALGLGDSTLRAVTPTQARVAGRRRHAAIGTGAVSGVRCRVGTLQIAGAWARLRAPATQFCGPRRAGSATADTVAPARCRAADGALVATTAWS